MIFTDIERAYLAGQQLGRFATVGPHGTPRVRPLGFRLNDDGTIDIGGPRHADSRRYRDAQQNPYVTLVVDDLTAPDDPDAVKPGMGRGVEIRGRAELLTVDEPPVAPEWFSQDIIRIHPERILSWHLDPERPDGWSRNV
ncbi:PPOX class F420-dependent oxidoreductase [Streptomyces boncukensis]|uniref:PPOX class F420-dependent oxidoreductase n=1 Tax=Streptomyces boncukensis TaxID=2711219 RepID=A0A6G4X8T6_9ACTN|nr:PPOX class F420-dependent oxidoreductase [Streptomyces boncukensis]NGO73164.1 PPOX class F420-dependent oxidoreductase [Streptomyces boncukensis]